MKRIIAAALFCALALGASGAAFAQPDGPNPGAPKKQLTQEQLEQARKIFQDNYASTDAIRQQLAAKREQLDTVLSSPNPDKGLIESLSREIGELRGKLLAARVDARSQLESEGLPPDAFGPGGPGRGGRDNGREVWQGGHHRGHGPRHDGHRRGYDGPYGWGYDGPCGWGCPGMMRCW